MIKKAKYAAQAIPTRFRFSGDIEKCKLLMGYAKQQFARRLEIDSGNQYNRHLLVNRKWPMIKSRYGELIKMQMLEGVSVIDIYVPPGLVEVDGKVCKKVCPCGCGITIGGVIESRNSSYNEETEEITHDLTRIPQWYDPYKIIVCAEDQYTEKTQQMFSLDFYQHKIDEIEDIPNHYFVIGEDIVDDVEYDLTMINACKWELYHLISLDYGGPKTELVCM